MDKPSLRIGDAERDAAVELLQSHYAAGRLTTEEFDERMTGAFAAHYQADLDLLFTDLPSDPQVRFFDETGPVGQAARPSELTPWQAPASVAAQPAGRRAAAAALGAVSGLVWPAAIIAFMSGVPVQVLFLALVVSVAAGAARKGLHAGGGRALPAGDDRAQALPGGSPTATGAGARDHRARARSQARAVRDAARLQRRQYRARRRGR